MFLFSWLTRGGLPRAERKLLRALEDDISYRFSDFAAAPGRRARPWDARRGSSGTPPSSPRCPHWHRPDHAPEG